MPSQVIWHFCIRRVVGRAKLFCLSLPPPPVHTDEWGHLTCYSLCLSDFFWPNCHVFVSLTVTVLCHLLSRFYATFCHISVPLTATFSCHLLSHFCVTYCHIYVSVTVTFMCHLPSHLCATYCPIFVSLTFTFMCHLLSYICVTYCHIFVSLTICFTSQWRGCGFHYGGEGQLKILCSWCVYRERVGTTYIRHQRQLWHWTAVTVTETAVTLNMCHCNRDSCDTEHESL